MKSFSNKAEDIIAETKKYLDESTIGWDVASAIFAVHYNTGNDMLNKLLCDIHKQLNRLFEILNSRAKNHNRFNARNSRQLIIIMDIWEKLANALMQEGITIRLDKNYQKHILQCRFFLKEKNGSDIPIDYKKLELIEYNEIFEISKSGFESPNYLIFGVSKKKPDIRIKDVLDGTLEIINKDNVLIYNREINNGLLYEDFDAWWEDNKEKYLWYKKEEHLEKREVQVLDFYKKNYRHKKHPVLIPQVYLHYDPKNKKEREKYKISTVLVAQRMDFLMLYNGKRIIIELDGYSHFTTNNQLDIKKYAKQVEYDRTMKFLGYEVFRICNAELDMNFEDTLKTFFGNLYQYLGITLPN